MDQPIPLKQFTLIVGFDSQGDAQAVQYAAHANRRMILLGRPGKFIVMETKNIIDGSSRLTEFNLANVIAMEYEPLAVVEAAPAIEAGPVTPEVPEMPQQ